MLKHDKIPQDGILRLLQAGRATNEDFQKSIPDLMRILKSQSFPNFLLEIEHLEQDGDYVDPDLAFWTLNEIKHWISRMAIVCPAEFRERARPVQTLMTNYNIPTKIFDKRTDALVWLGSSSNAEFQ